MRRFIIRSFFLFIVPIVCLSLAGYFYMSGGRYVETKNAYVKSRLVNISSDIDGRVIEVKIRNNQAVSKGDLLFRIDPEPAEIELMGAQAEIGNVRLRIDSLKSQYKQTLLEIDGAKEQIRFLESQLKRQEKLMAQGNGLEIDYDNAKHELEMGRRALATANQRSDVVLADLGGNPKLAADQHAMFLAAQAKVDKSLLDIKKTYVTAPVNGVLSNVNLESGEYVEAGDLIFSIVETSEVWVEANMKESQLTHLKEGQDATIVVDAYPDTEFKAKVSSLSPATGAEFAVLPPQNATGNWVKVVQRIPVRLDFLNATADQPLRAGMTTTVNIDTHHKRQLPQFVQTVLASVTGKK